MTNEKTPTYIIDLKADLINHIDSSINTLVLTINETVALKDDIKNMATKEDIKEIWDNMATKEDIKDMATKRDVKEILSHIGAYEVRARKIEEILLDDHKPRIIDLEKEVYSK